MPADERRRPPDADDAPRRKARPILVALAVAALAAPGGSVGGQEGDRAKGQGQAKTKARPQAKAAKDLTDDEAEAVALAFVGENHPELAALLAQLKAMKADEYRKAVRELAQVSRSLAAVKANNPRRYATGLEVWKARSRVDLLAARLAGGSGQVGELEGQLRQAVEAAVDAEIRQTRAEKEIAEERLLWLDKNLNRLESGRNSLVETRVQALVKKSQRARRKAAQAAGAGDSSDVNVDAGAGTGAGLNKKGERQP